MYFCTHNIKRYCKMKKLLLIPVLTFACLFASCTKEETYITQGAYVYTEYPRVGYNQWEADIIHFDNGTYATNYWYYVYENPYIDRNLIEGSFLLTYYVDENGRDVPLPTVIKDATGTHSALIRYDVEEGKVAFIVEALDGDYTNTTGLGAWIPDAMTFKVCMMINR